MAAAGTFTGALEIKHGLALYGKGIDVTILSGGIKISVGVTYLSFDGMTIKRDGHDVGITSIIEVTSTGYYE